MININLISNQQNPPVNLDLSLNQTPMPVSIGATIPVIPMPPFKTYIHDQMVASKSWRIIHDLERYPSVTIVDTGGNMFMGEVQYISNNELIISFSGSFSGKAYLN